MKRMAHHSMVLGAVCLFAALAKADVVVVMQEPDTVSSGSFSAFAFNPATDEFRTTGYLSGHDFRWSILNDDTVAPWDITGGQLLSNFQLEIFARDGYAGNRSSWNFWGMDFCPIDQSYFLTGIASLKGPSGTARLDAERDLVKHYPGFPDSPQIMPTNCWVSDAGGVYTLGDDNLTSANGFLASGVQAGHRVTIFPIDWMAKVYAQTYTITQVVSDNVVRLDKDPSYATTPPVTGIGYIMSVQPHVTLGTFRQNIPYFAANLGTGPKAHYKGGLSPDGLTLYLGEAITNNIIAVDTQTPEQFSIFTGEATLQGYVQAQIDAGRHLAIVNPYRIITDGLNSVWNDVSVNSTVVLDSTEQFVVGEESAKVTFDGADSEFTLEAGHGYPPDPAGFEALSFWMHGGTSGGQQMDLWLVNSNGVGDSVVVPPPQANTWTQVVIPMSQFSVADDIFWISFTNASGSAQPAFYIDQLEFLWTDPLPAWAGAFDPENASVGLSQTDVDEAGRVWFSEGETDDIIWTSDGTTLHTFLPSSTIAAVYASYNAIDVDHYSASNAVQVMGMTHDPMGNLYWSDNQTNSIWKVSPRNPGRVIPTASKEALQTALNLGTASPRGMHCFTIRGKQLLTFNFVDCDCLYTVDLNTFDFGDFDGDFDVDADDSSTMFDCLAGPGVTEWPASCTSNAFEMADLDDDGDVDVGDFSVFQVEFGAAPAMPLKGGNIDAWAEDEND